MISFSLCIKKLLFLDNLLIENCNKNDSVSHNLGAWLNAFSFKENLYLKISGQLSKPKFAKISNA